VKLRAACVIGFAFACAVLTAACSFSDRAEHCDSDSQCTGGRCYEGFCIPARDPTSTSAQTASDGETSPDEAGGLGGAGAKVGSGGKGGQRASSPAGGSGSGGIAGAKGGGAGGKASTTSMMPPASGSAAGQPCKAGQEQACLLDPANKLLAETCNRGMQACEDGAWGICNGQPMPVAEICNGMDDDCNGEVDDLVEVCYLDGQAGCSKNADGRWSCAGSCGTGTRSCRDGKLSDCEGATVPAMEVCTPESQVARNEDCDDQTDEGCGCRAGETRACYSGRAGTMGVGKCVAGMQTCTNGAFGACTGEVHEQAETCANLNADDDCNGTTDDVPTLNSRCMIADAQGPCANGTMKCSGTTLSCQATVMPVTEVCNGRDDDCNGRADDTFNLRRDPLNCGTCGNRCDSGDACCAGACTNTQTNATNCGACGTSCADGQRCMSGKCMATSMPMAGMPAGGSGPTGGSPGTTGGAGAGGAGSGGACAPACAAGETCCRGSCVNLMTDPAQCGACGNACMGANMGCCSGRCTSLTTDTSCGQCGRDCTLLHVDGMSSALCQCMATNGAAPACQAILLGLGLCVL
jgi:hypothetical protein